MPTATNDAATQAYAAGVRNAHALERQAIQLIDRQAERLDSYPEVAAVLRQHKAETEAQVERLDAVMADLGTGSFTLKDLGTMLAGDLAAIGHAVMPDEVIKNHLANCGFEAIEIATYRSLIAMAEATGHAAHVPAFEASLREEQATEEKLQGMTAALSQST